MSAHLTSSHLFSPLLTSSKLFSHLLTSSQLLSALPSSCQLFSPQLNSSQLTLRSSQLFSGPKPAPKPHLGARAEKSTILKLVQKAFEKENERRQHRENSARTHRCNGATIPKILPALQRGVAKSIARLPQEFTCNSHCLCKQDCTDT